MNSRKYHKIVSIAIALPLLVIISTGILLILRSKIDFIQPKIRETQKQNFIPSIKFEDIYNTVNQSERKVDLKDISDISFKPSRGVILVRTKDLYEIQIDADSGKIIHEAKRFTSLLTSIHEGAWFHPFVKDWIFLPSSILFLTIWLSGVWIFVVPLYRRRTFKKN